MFAKIISLILVALVGLSIATVKQPSTPQTQTPQAVTIVEKNKISTTTPSSEIKKPENKTATTSPSAEIKKPVLVKPKAAGVAATPAATSSLVASAPLPTLNLKPTIGSSTTPTPVNFENINLAARQAVVNIFCTSKSGGLFEPISGSGVIIDPRGIILTNAHVAEFLLLQDYSQKDFLTCIARTGSPAIPSYTLKLLFISPEWVRNNSKVLISSKPTGTGENDFALIKIVGSTNPDVNLPASFPSLKIDTDERNIKENDPVVLVGYPAGFLGGIAIQRDLYTVSTIVNIGERYTFNLGTLDLFSLGGSPVAQQGASGGAVVSKDSKLLGIIVTSTEATTTSGRDLDAISVAHINRSFASTTGSTLGSLFNSDLTEFSKAFDEQMLPSIRQVIYDELDSKK